MQMKNLLYAFLLLLSYISPAHADYPATIVYYVNTQPPLYSGAIEACDGYITIKNNTAATGFKWIKSDAESSTTVCKAYYRKLSDNSVYDSFNSGITKAGKCGTTVTPNLVTCAGDPPPPPCTAGDAGFSGIPQPSGSSASTLSPSSINQIGCKNGCLTKLDASRGNWYGGSDGSSYNVYGYSNYTGATCSVSSSNPAPSNAPPAPNIKDCADAGKSYGTVNGVPVCVSAGSTGSAPVIQNKTGASSTSTPAPTPENPNPTPVTTKEPDSMVISVPPSATSDGTVKTGQTNADGSQTSTTESKESFCSKNPASEQCQAKSLCEKNPDAPSCKDICEKKPDLLICKQTDIDQLCADKPDRWECKKAEDLIGKKDDLPNEELGKKSVNVGDNFNFNPVNIQSNATCPPPLTTAIAGATITVSFDWLCAYASAFRPLVMALAFFFAYGIIAAAIRADAQPYQRGLF